MNAEQVFKLAESLKNGFPGATIGKWVSHEDHEEIEINDDSGTIKIRFFPKGESE